jgi:hypothetical protein
MPVLKRKLAFETTFGLYMTNFWAKALPAACLAAWVPTKPQLI